MLQGRLGQHLKRAEPVTDGTADHRIAAVRRDQAFQNGSIPGGPCQHPFLHGSIFLPGIPEQLHQIHIHGLNHKAVIIVPVEHGAVSINAVPLVPVLKRPKRIGDPRPVIIRFTQNIQPRFHHGGEENPVVSSRRDDPGRTKRPDQIFAHLFRKRARKPPGRAHQRMAQKSRVHQRLCSFREVHEICRLRVRRPVDAADCPFSPELLQFCLFSFQPFRFQPGRKSQHASSKGLQRRKCRAFLMKRKRHASFQFFLFQRAKYRRYDAQHGIQPFFSCFHVSLHAEAFYAEARAPNLQFGAAITGFATLRRKS